MHIAGSRFDKCAHAALGQRWLVCENDTARTTFYVCALASYSHTATCIATTLLHRGCRCCCVSSWLAVPITAIVPSSPSSYTCEGHNSCSNSNALRICLSRILVGWLQSSGPGPRPEKEAESESESESESQTESESELESESE